MYGWKTALKTIYGWKTAVSFIVSVVTQRLFSNTNSLWFYSQVLPTSSSSTCGMSQWLHCGVLSDDVLSSKYKSCNGFTVKHFPIGMNDSMVSLWCFSTCMNESMVSREVFSTDVNKSVKCSSVNESAVSLGHNPRDHYSGWSGQTKDLKTSL